MALESAKGKLQKRFEKMKIHNCISIDNGGHHARICFICDPNDVSAAFENGAQFAGSSSKYRIFNTVLNDIREILCYN
jgi:hypothetical protein